MSFSICMLTYDNLEKFEICLKSMYPFLYNEKILEILIWDNGSNRNMVEFLSYVSKSFNKIKVFLSHENIGVAGGRKKLYDLAKGSYILSLDSDIEMIDCDYLLNIVEWSLCKDENLFLLGGGGGNHTHLPTLHLEDVKQLSAKDKKNEIILLDDVAGWCHCFKRELLDKIEMDIQFSPFWGEDTDLCLQIKALGGKCGIFGKGIIKHKFSTCRDSSKFSNMLPQWEKLINKWYTPIYDWDKDWYSELYETLSPTHDYFSRGIFHGRIFSRKYVDDILGNGFSKESLLDIERGLTLDKLFKYHYTYENLPIFNGSVLINKKKKKYVIEYNNEIFNIRENVKTNRYIFLMFFSQFITKDCVVRYKGKCEDSFDLKYNRLGLKSLIVVKNENITHLNEFNGENLISLFQMKPIQKILYSSLMIPFDYDNKWCPEYSPKHVFPELFVRLYKLHRGETLSIVIGNSYCHESLHNVKGDIVFIDDTEIIEKMPKCTYYHAMINPTVFKVFKFLMDGYVLYDYENIVFIDIRKFSIVLDPEEIYDLSQYQNMNMIHNDFENIFFTFKNDQISSIFNIVRYLVGCESKVDARVDISKSFMVNLFEQIYFNSLWKMKEGEFKTVEFYREDDVISNLKDFPLLLR